MADAGPPPGWMQWNQGGVNVSSSNYVPQPGDMVIYGSPGAHIGGPIQATAAPVSSVFRSVDASVPDLLDVDRVQAQTAKLQQLLQIEPPVELLERLDPEYVGEIEVVRIVGADEIDYAIEFTTPRGKMRIHRRPNMTWEETLIRAGLLDGP